MVCWRFVAPVYRFVLVRGLPDERVRALVFLGNVPEVHILGEVWLDT